MLLVQSFSESLLTEGVIQLHKSLWEAGGSKTGPWLNEGKQIHSTLIRDPWAYSVPSTMCRVETLTWPFIKLVLCPKLPL